MRTKKQQQKTKTSPKLSFLKWVSWVASTNFNQTVHFKKGFPLYGGDLKPFCNLRNLFLVVWKLQMYHFSI